MSGQMKNYKMYYAYIKKMPAPIMPSQLPHEKINFRAIANYAKINGINVAKLSKEEKQKLVETIGKNE